MRETAVWILCIYSLAQAWIIWYFFVYKQEQANKEYERKMKELNNEKIH